MNKRVFSATSIFVTFWAMQKVNEFPHFVRNEIPPGILMVAGANSCNGKDPTQIGSLSLWYLQESNQGHTDFQSVALPSELRYPHLGATLRREGGQK